MARLVALYKTPKDLAAFDRYYFSTHIPLAKTIPGLTKYEISDGGVHSPEGPSDYHLVAILHFGSVADIQAAFASPEVQATAADLGNFADGGVELLLFETREV
ncbi:EthD family reductase [Mesorhizobium neociceri]|uniref:EthD family reductase n=1 Tax=Mesorhizobium neociceri TaxID=1307853 RepID=A0A838B3Z4_9HYPH|nr:EthD family reductase [Mesorhizobium neociceri]MBA1141125.1 EthD family reductase [Mesorhizobium neociceri]